MATSSALLPPSSPAPPRVAVAHDHDDHFSHARTTVLDGLRSCSTMAELRQRQSQLVRLGLSRDNDAAGRLLCFCALHPSGDVAYALRLFEGLPSPDPFVYNTLIRADHHHRLPPSYHPLLLYSRMLRRAVAPNRFTFPALVKSVSAEGSLAHGQQVHAHVLKLGFHGHGFSQNGLVHMYVSCGRTDLARQVFDEMSIRDVVSWTTMMHGYAGAGLIDDSRVLFEQMPEKNSVSWNTMISAYVRSSRFKEAFELFDRMMSEGMPLDKFVAASMLSACAGLGAAERGQLIHERVVNGGIDIDSKLATTIIDMYCKCGSLEKAYEVFDRLARRELSSWNCMIGGLAVHGQGESAIELFGKMEMEGVEPDEITLLNVLTGCAHAGLVDQGRHLFTYMVETYGIEPKMEHFGCMVDLFGRSGLVSEAKKLLDAMPMEPDASVLGALVAACKTHGELELGEHLGRRAIELEPHNSGRYVLLANIYAAAGRWEDVARVRRLMTEMGVTKEAGCSMIEMDGMVSEFMAGDRSHPLSREVYAKLDEMLKRIKLCGYAPDTDAVAHNIEEEEDKENPLFYHSEKLAIAFGLLNAKPGGTIRISKNLRVCKDCHEASKHISRAYRCRIVVRDRNRFHHFEDGVCSCRDFW
ncbi:hypothetical protein Taro_018350 [Colocasia esculenta]|uniref:DYW domain-containing protein n=1 Tax=Colocasia esculenta TaxID=4460 RepID=A0A843UQR5_COLES|nr:hypothetical protein [Colocasia esculenta]